MVRNYQKLLEKIKETEQTIKADKQNCSDVDENRSKVFLINSCDDVLEDYKNLKENITENPVKNYNLAYQPIRVKSEKWSTLDP